MRQPSLMSSASRSPSIQPLSAQNAKADIGRIKHRFKVKRVVFAGGADVDFANKLVTLVGAGRELVAEMGLVVLFGSECLDIFWRRFAGGQSDPHGLVGHDLLSLSSFLNDCFRVYAMLALIIWPPRAI